MEHSILVINCGSSSIKFSLTDPASGEHRLTGLAENLGSSSAALSWKGVATGDHPLSQGDHQGALQAMVTLLEELHLSCTGIGHRVVHGGEHFSGACPVNDDSIEALKDHIHLAPLHNPVNLLGIEAARAAFPDVEQVMVFDTSFHQSMPKQAYLYALPYELYKEHGIRKYGFHGTSHRYVSEQAAIRLNKTLKETALVTAHLGNGCSATAVLGGKSVDTTMGLTPLEGLVMGTRSGDVDPSLHQYLGTRLNMTQQEISDLLNKQSGLLGLSGQTNDMRELLQLEDGGDPQAHVAVEVFCYRLAKAVAALVVGLGRLDALVFTGGIGENSIPVRARTITALSFLGLELDPELNQTHGLAEQGRITRTISPCALVIPTDEELVIARDTARVI